MHTLSVPTSSAGGNDADLSRRYGGIRFQSGDCADRALGRQIAPFVWVPPEPAPSRGRTR